MTNVKNPEIKEGAFLFSKSRQEWMEILSISLDGKLAIARFFRSGSKGEFNPQVVPVNSFISLAEGFTPHHGSNSIIPFDSDTLVKVVTRKDEMFVYPAYMFSWDDEGWGKRLRFTLGIPCQFQVLPIEGQL